jgi:hypothetical protein
MMSDLHEDAHSYDNQPDVPYNTYYPIKSAFQYDNLYASEDENFIQNLSNPEHCEFADYPKLFEECEPIEQPVLPDNNDIDKFYVTNP